MALNEDAIYRASTQYRLWSFTTEALASLREETNAGATVRVRSALRRASRIAQNGADIPDASQVDCLTPSEELLILRHYTRQLLAYTSPHRPNSFAFPSSVGATAAQYLRRFYLSNSPMTYHPKSLIPTALFLAAKVEDTHVMLDEFTRKLRDELKFTTVERKPVTREDVLALEYVLGMGLRWAFDVRHPFRGLRGGVLEMIAMAKGDESIRSPDDTYSASQIQQNMIDLPLPAESQRWKDKNGSLHPAPVRTSGDLERRIQDAEKRSTGILEEAALLTDVYFQYSPSQIWLGAMHLADEPLASFFLSTKLGLHDTKPQPNDTRLKIKETIEACTEMLASDAKLRPSKEELLRIDKKLYQCLNPEKRDLSRLRQEQTQAATGAKREANGLEDDRKAKKRKLEQDARLRDEAVFGGELQRS